MVYLGSKRKLAPIITKIIVQNLDKGGTYLEPFCGGCAVAEALPSQTYKMQLSDISKDLIALFQLSQAGWIPPLAPESKEKWRYHKAYPEENHGITGYFKYLYGFRGSTFGYCVPDGDPVYYRQKRTSYLKTINRLMGAEFIHRSYKDIDFTTLDPNNTLIYCDPPYEGSTRIDSYNGLKNFNHNLFWQWVREHSENGYKILVSECIAPNDFISIKDISYKHILQGAHIKDKTESLYIHVSSKHLWKVSKRLSLL